MEEALKNLLHSLGISPLWASIVILLAGGLTFLAKSYAQLRSKLAATKAELRIKDLHEYQGLQHAALLKAYLRLYEDPTARKARGETFAQIVKGADEAIMDPFRRFRHILNDSLRTQIWTIHNVLAQFEKNPSDGAITNFFAFQHDFYRMIEQFENLYT